MARKAKTNRREAQLRKRHKRVRRKVFGTPDRPRLVVHRSSKHIQGHIVDDTTGTVLLGVSTTSPEFDKLRKKKGTTKTDLSTAAGEKLAEKAKEAGIEHVVFDRGGYLYHGRIAAFADGARESGLDF